MLYQDWTATERTATEQKHVIKLSGHIVAYEYRVHTEMWRFTWNRLRSQHASSVRLTLIIGATSTHRFLLRLEAFFWVSYITGLGSGEYMLARVYNVSRCSNALVSPYGTASLRIEQGTSAPCWASKVRVKADLGSNDSTIPFRGTIMRGTTLYTKDCIGRTHTTSYELALLCDR
jgi:hypothetical protein